MAHGAKAGVTVALMSTESFPGEEAQHRGVQGSREPYRPNLFSLVAAERFAAWRNRDAWPEKGKGTPKDISGCSPKNMQHPGAVELMGARRGSEVSHGQAANTVSRAEVLDPP